MIILRLYHNICKYKLLGTSYAYTFMGNDTGELHVGDNENYTCTHCHGTEQCGADQFDGPIKSQLKIL